MGWGGGQGAGVGDVGDASVKHLQTEVVDLS